MTILKLDVDGKKVDWKRIRAVMEMMRIDVIIAKSKLAKTRRGFHIRLSTVRKLRDNETCFAQLAMGSDWRREVLNWNRVNGTSEWKKRTFNVLFTNKFHVTPSGKKKLVSSEKELPHSILARNLKESKGAK